MVSVSFELVLVICLILTLSQFGSVQSEVSFWDTVGTGINRFAVWTLNIVTYPYVLAAGTIQSETTKALCKRNTVQKTRIRAN